MPRAATRKRAPRRSSANGRGWVRGPSRAAPGAGTAYRRGRFEILADVVSAGGRRRHVWLVWEQVGQGWRVASEHELLKDAKAAATSTARLNSIGVYGQPPRPPHQPTGGIVRDGFAWRMNGRRRNASDTHSYDVFMQVHPRAGSRIQKHGRTYTIKSTSPHAAAVEAGTQRAIDLGGVDYDASARGWTGEATVFDSATHAHFGTFTIRVGRDRTVQATQTSARHNPRRARRASRRR